jgi:putative phosphonoacetaldehyde dehydrogenase
LRNHIITIRNPFDGSDVGEIEETTKHDINQALTICSEYKSELSRSDRSKILRHAAQALSNKIDYASDLISKESGLSKQDSIYEINRVIDVLVFSANEALRDDGEIFSCDVTDQGKPRKLLTMREPLDGIIFAITPFNHPINQVAHKVAPAVAANNRIILKPSEKVPLSALFFANLLYEAGLPEPMLKIVVGNPDRLTPIILSSPFVKVVSFTGGVETGKKVLAAAGYRRTILELGGNDPLIVMEDADLHLASDLAVRGSYSNSGQRCTAVKRLLVQKSVIKRFTELVVEKTKEWEFGDPFSPSVKVGTVINETAAHNIQKRVSGAISNGARLLIGNQRCRALYSPTVLDNVTYNMDLVMRETFGPVTPILAFNSIEEAIFISNSTSYGLSAGICTNRLDWITKLSKELNVGSVNVWEVPGFRIELTPFGGIKDSGLGQKEGVREAFKNFTNLKTLSFPW